MRPSNERGSEAQFPAQNTKKIGGHALINGDSSRRKLFRHLVYGWITIICLVAVRQCSMRHTWARERVPNISLKTRYRAFLGASCFEPSFSVFFMCYSKWCQCMSHTVMNGKSWLQRSVGKESRDNYKESFSRACPDCLKSRNKTKVLTNPRVLFGSVSWPFGLSERDMRGEREREREMKEKQKN